MFRIIFAALMIVALLLMPVAGPVGPARAVEAGPPPRCTVEQGQGFIDSGRYDKAVREFTCVIDANPTGVEGYRGRIEAQLLLGRYSDALGDYSRITAFVVPVQPDAVATILAGYAARLAATPNSIPALTGASFARWRSFQYAQAIQLLENLLVVKPNDLYGTLFRGSARLLLGANPPVGVADLERALALAPTSRDVRFIVADAYTYGRNQSDPQRAFAEGTLALNWGLDTPRVHAILASAYFDFGDPVNAALHLHRHFQLVTTHVVPTAPLAAGSSMTVALAPGRTYEIPIAAAAGDTIAVTSRSNDLYDTIAVLLAPDGTPVTGSDDYRRYFAGFQWVATQTATYRLWMTSFESIDTGDVVVQRGR